MIHIIDPLQRLLEIEPFDSKMIKRFILGDKYVGIMLKNGRIGVCATLQHHVLADPLSIIQPDLSLIDHRIITNAYLNACLNYNRNFEKEGDIFDLHTFTSANDTVMIGYFRPLLQKFKKKQIPLTIFDRSHNTDDLTPLSEMRKHLVEAEVLILTSTSVSNGSFSRIMNIVNPSARVFLLGPSTPMHDLIFEYKPIKQLFGMVFDKDDHEVMELIGLGHGPRTFGRRGKKVSL